MFVLQAFGSRFRDTRTVYPVVCSNVAGGPFMLCAGTRTGVLPTLTYRVDVSGQRVVYALLGAQRLEGCAVYDADNWFCSGGPNSTEQRLMMDGVYGAIDRSVVSGQPGVVYVSWLEWWLLRVRQGYGVYPPLQ